MNIGFTGHRPNRLGGYDQQAQRCLYKFVRNQMLKIEDEHTVYQGCALGFDMAVATAALEQGHRVVSCIPFLGFNARWPLSSVLELDTILNRSSEVIIVVSDQEWAKEHAPIALNQRNNFIVDNTSQLFALACGAPSGTQNCVDYAVRHGKSVKHLWRDWLKYSQHFCKYSPSLQIKNSRIC